MPPRLTDRAIYAFRSAGSCSAGAAIARELAALIRVRWVCVLDPKTRHEDYFCSSDL